MVQRTDFISVFMLTSFCGFRFDYQFIKSNTEVDADKVTELISYLSNNSAINIDGYGIFALSSSHGIGYGIFIPDNLDLSTMDVKYTYNDTLNCYVLIDMSEYNLDNPTDVARLKEDMAKWRGGYVAATATDTQSVDYAFYNDMKQLKLSISTDIFVLNFNSNTINSADDQIDSANGVIIYYVDFTTFNEIYGASSLTISKSKLATCSNTSLQ